jgi:hypothetical protein
VQPLASTTPQGSVTGRGVNRPRTRITLPKDTFATLTQALGGTYTVNVGGNLARVDGTDADALGLEALELVFEPTGELGMSQAEIMSEEAQLELGMV